MESTDNIKLIIDTAKLSADARSITVKRGNENEAEITLVPGANGTLVPAVVNPKELLDKWRTLPERIAQAMTVHVLASFIDLVRRFVSQAQTVLFTSITDNGTAHLTAIVDFHQGKLPTRGEGGRETLYGDEPTVAQWGAHRITYTFPTSDEWKIWSKTYANIDQQTFAELIEDNIESIIEPGGIDPKMNLLLKELGIRPASRAVMMNLVKGLKMRVDHHVENRRNLDTGEVSFEYKEEMKGTDGAPLVVPNGFMICIPVFREGIAYMIPVRMRFRTKDGKVTWSLVPYHLDASFRDAVKDCVDVAIEAIGVPHYFGVPPEPVK